MESALKRAIRAHLRPRGFVGSLPHLRRRSADRIDLISVQFHSAGGSFVVEVAACGPTGYTTSWGRAIGPSLVRARDIPTPRPRLGSPTFPKGDHWFVYGPRAHQTGASSVLPVQHYQEIAIHVVHLIDTQAASLPDRRRHRTADGSRGP